MGQKSKLTDKQWEDIERRLLENEPARALAREFKVTEGAIRKRKGTQVKQIKTVANQIVETERNFRELPIGAQISTQRYAAKLMSISDDMLDGAVHAASNFRRLSAMSSAELDKVNAADPVKSELALKASEKLTDMANRAAASPISLIVANKETVKENLSRPPPAAQGVDLGNLSDSDLDHLERLATAAAA